MLTTEVETTEFKTTAATRIVEAFEERCEQLASQRESFVVIAQLAAFAIDAVARTVLRDHNLSTLEDYHGLCLRIHDAERKAMGC